MNTFKTAVVLATLLGVGYGMHVVLNQPTDNGDEENWTESASGSLASLNLDAFSQPGAANSATPAGSPSATDPSGLNPTVVMPPSNPLAAPLPTAPTVPPADLATSPPLPAGPVPPLDPYASPASTPNSSTSLSPPPPLPSTEPNSTTGPTTAMTELTAVPPAGPPTTNGPPTIQTVSAEGISASARNLFAESFESAQSQVRAGQYVDALLKLSLSLSTDELTDADRSKLLGLLDQLAGTVIYSPQSLLEAPYVVQPGETWESIASRLQVTPDFLTRVNQLSAGVALVPGQSIKVVRGPFRGEVNVGRRELTLFLERMYAGRFEIAVGKELPPQVTTLHVAMKDGPRPYYDRGTGQVIQAAAPDNPYGSHWIGLQEPTVPTDQGLGIHGTGPRVGATDTRGCISVSEQDADDLAAILSIGSRVTIVR